MENLYGRLKFCASAATVAHVAYSYSVFKIVELMAKLARG